MDETLGLIHCYTGENKGKTTAALGLALRASGAGLKVLIIQFLKSGQSGELNAIKQIDGITIKRNDKKFPFMWKMDDQQKVDIKTIHNNLLKEAIEHVEKGEVDLLILDELSATYNYLLIDREMVEDFVDNKPKSLEMVITGRDLDDFFVQKADYITEMKKIKHPYDKGITSRKGIEF